MIRNKTKFYRFWKTGAFTKWDYAIVRESMRFGLNKPKRERNIIKAFMLMG